jgi:enoyl-[acyl-carrier protein] reductase I
MVRGLRHPGPRKNERVVTRENTVSFRHTPPDRPNTAYPPSKTPEAIMACRFAHRLTCPDAGDRVRRRLLMPGGQSPTRPETMVRGDHGMSTMLMSGKRGLIMGLANDKSIAWGIAKACAEHGAELAFSYQGGPLKKRVEPLAAQLGSDLLIECDVSDEGSLDRVFDTLRETWGRLDFVVHAIAYSDKTQLRGRYVDTTAENFRQSMDISVYSFTAVCQRASALMTEGGSCLTLTYYGAEKVMPHYNMMGVAKAALEASVKYMAEDLGKDGVRVNAISAGPIKTLAASGIGDFRYIMKWNEYNSPLRRNVTQEEVGKAALYLLSDLGSGTTGENLHVDAGYHVVGMKAVDAPDMSKA